jgi:hypothetical protein
MYVCIYLGNYWGRELKCFIDYSTKTSPSHLLLLWEFPITYSTHPHPQGSRHQNLKGRAQPNTPSLPWITVLSDMENLNFIVKSMFSLPTLVPSGWTQKEIFFFLLYFTSSLHVYHLWQPVKYYLSVSVSTAHLKSVLFAREEEIHVDLIYQIDQLDRKFCNAEQHCNLLNFSLWSRWPYGRELAQITRDRTLKSTQIYSRMQEEVACIILSPSNSYSGW